MIGSFLVRYISVLVPLIALDAIWLGVIAKQFYRSNIGYVMGEPFKWIPALLFYLLYSVALVVFAIQPSMVSSRPVMTALWRGALLGLIAYGTYNLTNHATIKGWPLTMTIVDMSWGTLATAIVCVVAVLLSARLG
jgi:uncharacterized membrane protein